MVISSQEYSRRRQALLAKMQPGSAALIFAAPEDALPADRAESSKANITLRKITHRRVSWLSPVKNILAAVRLCWQKCSREALP